MQWYFVPFLLLRCSACGQERQDSNYCYLSVMLMQLEAWAANTLDTGEERMCGLLASERVRYSPGLGASTFCRASPFVPHPPSPVSGGLLGSFHGLRWERSGPDP